MFIEMKKRQYKMRQRARDLEDTRRKIVEAAAELHGTVGPRNTTISSVAERAGVQRLTVYRHFPDDVALFQSCSAHWLALNPPPDIDALEDNGPGAGDRTRKALEALYSYYRQTQSMWRLVYRDLDEVEALQEPMAGFEAYLDAIVGHLLGTWQPKGRRSASLQATVRHAVAFSTWDSLSRSGLTDSRIGALVLRWIEAVAPKQSRAGM